MEISVPGWMVPTAITVLTCGYAIFIHRDSDGYMSGLGNIMLLVPALAVSMITWIIYAIIK